MVSVGMIGYPLQTAAGSAAGIGRYTRELLAALARLDDGPRITLLTARDDVPCAAGVRRAPLPGCRLLPGLLTLGNLQLPRAARRERLDVLHDPTGVSPFLFGAGGARSVVTLHDVFPWSCPGASTTLDTIIYRHWLPRLARRVDAVITVSQASKADIIRYLGVSPNSIRVIYEGVNPAYRPLSAAQLAAARARYALPRGYLLYVGSIEARKNLARLLRAYAALRREGEERPLALVGVRRWNAGPILAALAELRLQEHVIFTGYVAEADLPALYGGADLFVFPSLYEGFGLPPLEAMACGAPVVCSNAASLPEVVGDAALTVDPTDVEALAQAMRQVLSDESLRADLRARGLRRARQFTWERAAQETAALYREVCA